jgi:hypothetical protein
LVVRSEDTALIYAVDPKVPFSPPELHRRGMPEIETLEYLCDLERLGLQAGTQELSDATELRLPVPTRSKKLIGGTWTEGQVSEGTAGILAGLNLGTDNMCNVSRARFRSRELMFINDERDDPAFNLSLDENTAFVASLNGFYYLVDRDGAITRIDPFPDGEAYAGGYRAFDGELWLMTLEGRLVRGTLDTGFEVVTSSAPFRPSTRVDLVGPRGDAPLELYALTDARDFLRFDGAKWEVLARSDDYDEIFRPQIAWVRPNEAVAIGVGRAANTVVRYRDGEAIEELLPDHDIGLSAIAFIPQFGLVLGRDDGAVFFNDGSGWVPEPKERERFFVRSIVELEGGLFYGAGLAQSFFEYELFQFYPSLGHCPPDKVSAYPMTHISRFDANTFLGASLADFEAPTQLTLFEIAEPAFSCTE